MKFVRKAMGGLGLESLVGHAHHALSGYENARSVFKVHISDMTNLEVRFCPREFALCQEVDLVRKGRYVNTSLRTTFDIGNAIHDLVREKWFRDIAFGDWKCWSCGSLTKYSRYPGKLCQYCGKQTRWEYKEVVIRDEATGVTGSLDFLADFNLGRPLILAEIKSDDKDLFKKRTAPEPEHIARVNAYLQLIARNNVQGINTDWGYVFYSSKSFGFKADLNHLGVKDKFSPFKEFRVERMDDSGVPDWTKAEEFHHYKKTGELPSRICPTAVCSRAKKCAVAKVCFSEKYS